MTSSAIGRFAIGISPIGLPDSYDKEGCCVTTIPVTVVAVVQLVSGSGTVLSAVGVLAGDQVLQAVDLVDGRSAAALFAPRAPADGLLVQTDTAGESSGRSVLVLLRRSVPVTYVTEIVPSGTS